MRIDRVLFPGGKEKAATFSFDDAVVEDERLVQLLNKYGLKGTFNISSKRFGSKERIPGLDRELYHEVITKDKVGIYEGHEVAAHGQHHLSMTDCPPDSALSDVLLDRAKLERMLGRQIRGFAYPFGRYNEVSTELLEKIGIYYARTIRETFSFELPENFLVWNPTCHILSEKRDELLRKFFSSQTGNPLSSLKLFYVWGHGYELTIADAWESFETFLEELSGHSDIWYATNLEIVHYMRAVSRLEYSTDRSIVYNPSAESVWINLNGKNVEIKGGDVYKELHDK